MSEVNKAVFLSYASQDAEAARRIAEALRSAGVEVWFDQSELVGGDAWDQKIRTQIKECSLFVPVISANTQSRAEGYFRLEWKLAVDRSHLMADDQPFLFPIVVGDVRDAEARVPDKFRDVQWTRVRFDEVPSEVAARIARLLSGNTGPSHPPRPDGWSEDLPDRRRQREKKPVWLRYALSVVILAMAAFYGLRPLWNSIHDDREGEALSASALAATISEARQLANRARDMSLDNYDSTAVDYEAAESLLKQALKLDPNDGEIWAVSSLLNFSFQSRGFDHSPERMAVARRDAERALTLSPDSAEAMFALGRWQRDNEEPRIAEETMKKVLAWDPNHGGALYNLAWIYENMDRVDEAAALYERYAAQPGQAALGNYLQFLLYFHRARFEEANQCIRRSVAVESAANSRAMLALLLLTWKGDAGEAADVLASGSTEVRSEPRTIWTTAITQLCRRDPDAVLRTLERYSEDYIQDNWFSGPKTYFEGRAHALAGRMSAARIAWEKGLSVVDARLTQNPQNMFLRLMRGELLAFLGETETAMDEAQTLKELAAGRRAPWFFSPARIYAALGRADLAVPLLRELLATGNENVEWPLTRELLRIDPLWDNIRLTPEFQRLEVGSAFARDWPKNPELKRAISLLDGQEAIPEDFRLAEEIVQRVLDAVPMDPETNVAMARVQSMWLLRGWDRSDERYVKAKATAERALQISPNDPEALAALAIYVYARNSVTQGPQLARALELAKKAVEIAPDEPRFHRIRDNVLFMTPGVSDEVAIASAEQTVRLFPTDALVHYELARRYRDLERWADFDREVDAAIALGPVANAIVWKARAEFGVRGDLKAMKTLLDRVSSRMQSIERTVFGYFIYSVMSGDYGVGVSAVQAMPEPWMIDFDYRGPRTLLLAELLQLQGKHGLAQFQYEDALAEVKKQQLENSSDVMLRFDEAWILHGLGRDEEARAVTRICLEALQRPYRMNALASWWFFPIPLNLLLGERETALALIREVAASTEGRATIARRMQLDPRMKPFRHDPEIMALLAEPEKTK